MDKFSLTHRIVGAIVILSLAIIFVPILLETNQIKSGNLDKSPIPKIPKEIKTIEFDRDNSSGQFKAKSGEDIKAFENSVKQTIESSAKEKELSVADSTTGAKPGFNPKTTAINAPFEHTWMLQLASYTRRNQALAFRDKLRSANYVAILDERKLSNSTVWRVRVGPYARKEEASSVLIKINAQYHVKGILIQRR